MDDLQHVLVSLDEIEAILSKHDRPEPNPTVLSRIRFLAAQMSGRDSYISEKASRLAELAGVFYSEQRHARHQGGASGLLTEIAYDLPNRIRGQINHLRRIQKERQSPSDA
ncbi:hypothetical protein [Pseudomonas sp. LS-2]|uniref:hypothetical protein n=1 Tax=Pseudomonas sp. LS-2 TaxID=2315859 RepID=UPI000E71CC1D|nr:hypothetical protein [Pseudomonas sp. LS-2]RJX81272.1 hypothetical protein D3M70_09005 [Pseudomonas sp. LS-2]